MSERPDLPEQAETAAAATPQTEPVLARATVALWGGIRAGYDYWVDPSIPYISAALKSGFLVTVITEEETAVEPDTVDAE